MMIENLASKSEQFFELANRAAQNKIEIVNFFDIEKIIDESKTNSTGLINFGVGMFKNHGLFERCIKIPIEREIEEFVRRTCCSLRQTENARHSSQNEARHGIFEFKLIPEVSSILSRGVVDASFIEGGDVNGLIANRVVGELDVAWTRFCAPIVDGERKCQEIELTSIRKLSAFILRLVQMNENKKPASMIYSASAFEFGNVSHIFHRVTTDDWYTASRASYLGLLEAFSDDHVSNRSIEERAFGLCEWVSADARAFYDALGLDCARIGDLQSKSEFADNWHGVVVTTNAIDAATDAAIAPPIFMGSFKNETGRVFACSTAASKTTLRVLGVVRSMVVIRHVVATGSFALGQFDNEYVKTLVDLEKQRLAYKNAGIISKMLLICQSFECTASAETIDKFIDEIVDKNCFQEMPVPRKSMSASAVCGIPTASSSTAAFAKPQKWDFLVRPDAKLKSVDFKPSRVSRPALPEYFVVCSLASAVNEILSVRGGHMNCIAIGVANSSLVDRVASKITNLKNPMTSALGRFIDDGVSVNRASLTQLVSNTVRKLLKACSEAAEAARVADAPGAVSWTCSYQATRSTNELLLHVGVGVCDPICYVFLDACVRIKSFLDESWPLPEGMSWARANHRRGKIRRNQKEHDADIDATAATNVL